jgi:hypothetical protein
VTLTPWEEIRDGGLRPPINSHLLIRYELEDQPAGTLVTIQARGTPGPFFGWATPMMRRAVRKNIAADLERLRLCLEG